jgi:hypothetical protein
MPDPSPPDAPPPARKPWPMTWVVVVIVTYVVFYTAINVVFRKPPDAAHEPAAEAREREKNFVQATMNGWTRYAVTVVPRAADPFPAPAEVTRTPAPADFAQAVPVDLTLVFPGKPSMHPGPDRITAPAGIPADGVWLCGLAFDDPAGVGPLGEALAYAKDRHLRVFLQDEKRLPFEGAPLPATTAMVVALPPGVLEAGDWQATVYTRDSIFTWAFSVRSYISSTPAP